MTANTNIQIYNLKFSIIWVETFLDLLKHPPVHLGNKWEYKARVRSLLEDNYSETGDLELPWPHPSGQNFWKYYLEGRPIRITSDKAWKALLPLRRQNNLKFEISSLPEQKPVLLETFFYPHGLAEVVTVSVRVNNNTPLTLEEVIDIAFDIKQKKMFVQQQSENKLSLDDIINKSLTNSHIELVGKELLNSKRTSTPFTIFTFVEGDGIDPTTPISELEEAHRALEAVTKWHNTWLYDSLDSLDERRIKIRNAPPSHVLYGHTRGRAVWFPALFMPQSSPCRTLSCFHRNLTLASLQVESLGGLASITARELEKGIDVRGNYRDCAKYASGILGRLYGGVKTYRSWSPRIQIEQNQLIEDINQVRVHFGMPLLS